MPELESFLVETYRKIIEQTTSQKEILCHVVTRLDDMITTLQTTNDRFIQVIESMAHSIPDQLKESILVSHAEVIKSIDELANRIKNLKDGSDSGFIENAKDIEKMKNRINFLYAAFAIVVMQLVAVLLKIWL
jgi:hypothetical protein